MIKRACSIYLHIGVKTCVINWICQAIILRNDVKSD